jgi:hypothetical protein
VAPCELTESNLYLLLLVGHYSLYSLFSVSLITPCRVILEPSHASVNSKVLSLLALWWLRSYFTVKAEATVLLVNSLPDEVLESSPGHAPAALSGLSPGPE